MTEIEILVLADGLGCKATTFWGRCALFTETEAAVLLIAYKYPATRGAN